MSADEQLANLKKIVSYAYRTFPFYRHKMRELGLTPSKIKSSEDIANLPFLNKNELQIHCNIDTLTSRPLYLVGFTTGTTAFPAPVFTTHTDFSRWEAILAGALEMVGVGAQDTVQITFGRCGIACIVLLGAVRRLGATAIPFDADLLKPEQLLGHLDRFRVSTLLTFPSVAKQLCVSVETQQIRTPRHLRRICLMGESWSELVRDRIQQALDVRVYDIYGSTDTGLIGMECRNQNGLHIPEEHVLVEIVDPETGQRIPHGQDGEVVVTTFWKHAIPLIRYRTGDIAYWLDNECPCRLRTPRLSRIKGRHAEFITVGSCKLHPLGLEEVITEVCPTAQNYQVIVTRERNKDKLVFVIETEAEVDLTQLQSRLYTKLNIVNEDLISLIRLGAIHPLQVRLMKPGDIPHSGGKVLKVRDLRMDS